MVYCKVTACSQVEMFQCSRQTCCFYFCPEDEGRKFIRKVGTYIPNTLYIKSQKKVKNPRTQNLKYEENIMHPLGIANSDSANKILDIQNNFVIIYCSLQLLTSKISNFFPDDGGSQFFLNVGNNLFCCTVHFEDSLNIIQKQMHQ